MATESPVKRHHPKSWYEFATIQFESHAANYGNTLKTWQIISSAVENFINNNDLLRASALTYTVALSMVPILALAFSVLKGFGAENQLRPLIARYLALGSPETSSQLMGYVENVNATALGTIGAAFLLVTVISTLGNIEQAFNEIFRVPRSRTMLRKFSDYLSVLFTVPLLIAAALAVTTVISVRISSAPIVAHLAPYVFVWAGFFFLFVFFPYTKVHYGPALLGSLVSAVLFQFAQWGYVRFQIGMANYRAVYGALASVPIFLVWTYIAWAVVLFGAEVTASAQRGARPVLLRPESPDFPFAAILHILVRLGEQQLGRISGLSTLELARELGVSLSVLEPIVERLKEEGLVVEAVGDGGRASPSLHLVRAPASIAIADALATAIVDDVAMPGDTRVGALMLQIEKAQFDAVGSMTLADLIEPNAPSEAAAAIAQAELKPAR